ncbi:hypothetical protein N9D38_11490 [Rubripirellula sp.]|nr:hypothetical protein [Rubripirellula sp.]
MDTQRVIATRSVTERNWIAGNLEGDSFEKTKYGVFHLESVCRHDPSLASAFPA